jgi:pimeloyl-ACP methyl ester carboxylesterase
LNHKTISSAGGTVHYWTMGAGEQCILFTHGALMDNGLFQPQMDYFAKRYKVISWDVPAHGKSRPYRGFSLLNAARELVNILDAENIKAAHLVGQSMGGYIIQMAALDFPQRARSLSAVDSSPVHPDYYSALDTWLLSITPALLKLYPYNFLIETIAGQIALRESAREYALETLRGLTKTEIVDIMGEVYGGLHNYARDFDLPHPLLIVYGEFDRTGKVRQYCREWARRENRPLEIIPNAAHNANMDNPQAFNAVLGTFLENR